MTLDTYKWPLIIVFPMTFLMLFVMMYLFGLTEKLPEGLRTLASREAIHEQLYTRFTNYMLITFLYFMAMRLALPNPAPVYYWFSIFIFLRIIWAFKIVFEEMLFEGLTGIVGSESQNGDMTPSFQIRYSTSLG